MFNKVILVGNLTRDVELRYLPNGSALAKIGLAVNRRYKRQDGTQAEEVCFIDVNLFGRTAEVANQYLRRGSQILIEGRLVLESWTDNSGQKRSRHTITAESMQMLGSKSDNSGGNYNNYNANGAPQDSNYNQGGYNQGGYNQGGYSQGGYNQGGGEYNQNTYENNQNKNQYAKKPPKEDEIPVIDINDEEIPF